MFYRLKNENQLLDWADYKYSSDCIETDIITKEELDKNRNKVIVQDGILVLNPDYEVEELRKKKEEKLKENEIIRDNALNYGVEYKGILFDSDTDQKVNLMDTYSILKDNQTVTWLGKNNEPLECTKEDLDNIGNLIREKTSMIWMVNAQIKEKIASAQSVEELDYIEISY